MGEGLDCLGDLTGTCGGGGVVLMLLLMMQWVVGGCS